MSPPASADDSAPGAASAADVLLRALADHGIDFFFCNPGTDFPPIAEAFAQAETTGATVPKPIVVPHENAAVSMAHGAYMVNGRPQAVMVHVNVGTANTVCAIASASRDETPVFLMAGRTPVTESGAHGTRSRYIHWAQEMFDQAGMLREFLKWDYELRTPGQTGDAVARAYEMMMTAPRGPAYLMLPREVLGATARISNRPLTPRALPSPPHPDPAAIATLAEWVAAAENPLIVTSGIGRTVAGTNTLARVAERFALPVVSFNPRFLSLPSEHPMHLGFQPRPLLTSADLVIVLDCDVPWIPSLEAPPPDARVMHIGANPAFTRYPLRSFPSDLSITAEGATALDALEAALAARNGASAPALAARRQRLAAQHAALRAQWRQAGDTAAQAPLIKPEFLSRCIGEAVGTDAIIVNEYPLRLEHCLRAQPGTYFSSSPAGGLGWGLGAAIGAKLAAPQRLVAATLGDGTYMFGNPTPCHWVAAVQDAPILTVIFNNQLYGAVRNSTLAMYGKGAAAQKQGRMLADLSPAPAFEKIVEASGGYGARVEKPEDLPAALKRAVETVTREKRQALLNVICQY